MSYLVLYRADSSPPLTVQADEHRIEGMFHVFRCTATVMGSPRQVVVMRLALSLVLEVLDR